MDAIVIDEVFNENLNNAMVQCTRYIDVKHGKCFHIIFNHETFPLYNF
jgi:hypothetical protein